MPDDEVAALRAELAQLKEEVAQLREAQTRAEAEFPGPDKDDAITELRDLLASARFVAFDLFRSPGGSGIYGRSSLPWPDWISGDDSPFETFVHVEGADTAPEGSPLQRALRQRDEARLWAHGDYHRMWPFHTDVVPLWLHSSALPADPEIVREWQRRHPERRIEDF
jgi:hypothetical protein